LRFTIRRAGRLGSQLRCLDRGPRLGRRDVERHDHAWQYHGIIQRQYWQRERLSHRVITSLLLCLRNYIATAKRGSRLFPAFALGGHLAGEWEELAKVAFILVSR